MRKVVLPLNVAGDRRAGVEDLVIEEGCAVIDPGRLARGGWWLAAGALLLLLRLPFVEVIGGVVGSLLVVVGVVEVSRAAAGFWFQGGFRWALIAAVVAPLLEALAFVVEPVLLVSVAAVVRVAGALVLSWAAARRLDSESVGEAARRWSATFIAQLAIWVPIGVTGLGSAVMGESLGVEGGPAVAVFAVAAVPVAMLAWAAMAPAEPAESRDAVAAS